MFNRGDNSTLMPSQEMTILEHRIRKVAGFHQLSTLYYETAVKDMKARAHTIKKELTNGDYFVYISTILEKLFESTWSPVLADLKSLKDTIDMLSKTVLPNLRKDHAQLYLNSRLYGSHLDTANVEYEASTSFRTLCELRYYKYKAIPLFNYIFKKRYKRAKKMAFIAELKFYESKTEVGDTQALFSRVDSMMTNLDELLRVILIVYNNGVAISLNNDEQV